VQFLFLNTPNILLLDISISYFELIAYTLLQSHTHSHSPSSHIHTVTVLLVTYTVTVLLVTYTVTVLVPHTHPF